MKTLFSFIIALAFSSALALPVHARDTKKMMPISDAMEFKETRQTLDGSVKFFFGSQKHPKIQNRFGSDSSNRKTSTGESEENACKTAFLSSLIAFEKRAKQLGANAVVNIVSFYKKNEMSSPTEFECHVGNFMTGVALKGDFVKIGGR